MPAPTVGRSCRNSTRYFDPPRRGRQPAIYGPQLEWSPMDAIETTDAMSLEAAYRESILHDFVTSERDFPWRHTSDAFAVLVGEVLLQRTRGENVEPVYRELLRRWPTPQRLARAREATIEQVIRPLGLRKRSSVLHRLAVELTKLEGVPSDPTALDKLPGVGPYAAHSVPVFAYGENLPMVDWVIARVLRRFFGLESGPRPNQDSNLWALATRLATVGKARELWLGTLDLAAAVCKPRPRCGSCPLATHCLFAGAAA